jgi:cytochrome c-type biogenesis protein CcmE
MHEAARKVPRSKAGAVVTGVVATLGIVGVLTAFTMNASPYGTFEDARRFGSDNVHVYGDLVKDSLSYDLASRQIRFDMVDADGARERVVYSGAPPANMGDATKLAAIGGYRDGEFHSRKLLVKCPTKYEGESSPAPYQKGEP